MGKDKPGFLTPKAIANRIKSKGLQKLRWYCQMCQKQCRDENGFKCHTMSESHQRQLLLFGENAGKFLDEFSRDFNNGYLQILRRQFGTKRVNANMIYQEYIKDKDHVHMNATKWHTLSGYVQYLGRTGCCHVEQTEKGWFLTYIDRDPETLRRNEEQAKKKKLDLDDRERQQLFLEKQIEKAKEKEVVQACEPTELKKSQDEVIKISFIKKAANLNSSAPEPSAATTTAESKKPINEISSSLDRFDDQEIDEDDEEYNEGHLSMIKEENEQPLEQDNLRKEDTKPEEALVDIKPVSESKFKLPKLTEDKINNVQPVLPSTSSSSSSSATSSLKLTSVFKTPSTEKRKLCALDEIMHSEEKRKEKSNRKDYWLHKNIVVKIVTSKLGEKYHKKKGVVVDVAADDVYTGVVRLLDPPNSTLKIDQAHLETVLPALGKQVLVVNGAYRGELATLDEINEKEFSARITIAAGPLKGRSVSGVQYEDISKLHQN